MIRRRFAFFLLPQFPSILIFPSLSLLLLKPLATKHQAHGKNNRWATPFNLLMVLLLLLPLPFQWPQIQMTIPMAPLPRSQELNAIFVGIISIPAINVLLDKQFAGTAKRRGTLPKCVDLTRKLQLLPPARLFLP